VDNFNVNIFLLLLCVRAFGRTYRKADNADRSVGEIQRTDRECLKSIYTYGILVYACVPNFPCYNEDIP